MIYDFLHFNEDDKEIVDFSLHWKSMHLTCKSPFYGNFTLPHVFVVFIKSTVSVICATSNFSQSFFKDHNAILYTFFRARGAATACVFLLSIKSWRVAQPCSRAHVGNCLNVFRACRKICQFWLCLFSNAFTSYFL